MAHIRCNIWLAALTLVTLSGCDGPRETATAPIEAPRHVLVIVVDTLRADHLPWQGYHRDTAPWLARLAEESAVFTGAVSTSTYTAESIASLFTGKYPSSTAWGAGWHARPAPDRASLATLFQGAGYRTALFSESPMLDHPEFLRGFDQAECLAEFGLSGQGPKMVEKALSWLESNADSRTLLYLHFLDPHAPYDPPAEDYDHFGGRRPPNPVSMQDDLRTDLADYLAEGFGPGEARFEDMVQRYDAEIRFVDRAISKLFAGLDRMGIQDDTLALFTADHGEEFLDHGYVEHAWKLYPETYRVPLVFWSPGRIPPGRHEATVSLVDLLPTLLQLQQIPHPGGLDGRSLVSAEGPTWRITTGSEPRFLELLIDSRCVVRGVVGEQSLYLAYWKWLSPEACAETAGQLKAIRGDLASGARPPIDLWGPIVREEYYDLRSDPACTRDLAPLRPDVLAAPRALLENYGKSCPPQLPDRFKETRDPALLSPAQAETLRAVDPAYLKRRDGVAPDEEALETLGYL